MTNNIIKLGTNNILREKVQLVKNFEDIYDIVENMKKIIYQNYAAGLAANQVGIDQQIIVIRNNDNELIPFINPKIIKSSNKLIAETEGCLSIPLVAGIVPRPKEIKIKYQDINGKKHTETFYDMEARILCHEIDHLNGIVYLDRILDEKVIMYKSKEDMDGIIISSKEVLSIFDEEAEK